jgi:diacylglycerol kinase family enzyme
MPEARDTSDTIYQVFVNEGAGRGPSQVNAIAAALENAGIRAVVRAVPPAELFAAISAISAPSKTVAIAGGDGTQTAAAEILAGQPIALAPIPTGTLNHFARRTGVENIEDAAAALQGGHTSRVPVGVVNERLFLNTATFGLYADVVRRREQIRPWLAKWPSAAIAIVTRLIRMSRLHVTLEVTGADGPLERFTPLVWVGVGWGSFPIVHRAAERRGQPDLEIVVLRPRGRFGMVWLGFRFLRHVLTRNRPVEDPALEVLHARSLLIRSAGAIGVTLDGEVFRLEAPLFVGVVDDALQVVVPAPEEEDRGAG